MNISMANYIVVLNPGQKLSPVRKLLQSVLARANQRNIKNNRRRYINKVNGESNMSRDPNLPNRDQYTLGNESRSNVKGIKGGDKCHNTTPVSGQMTLGKPHNIGMRKGTFKGKASDLRMEQGSTRFSKGTRLAKADQAGTVSGGGAGHKAQTKGHASLSRGNFGKKPGKMNPQG